MNAREIELSDQDYEAVLNDIYGDVEICGLKYSAGRALRELDPVAFRCGKADYESTLGYECGECGKRFEAENDAEECCKEESE